MKKIAVILLISLLIPVFSFSQIGLPRKIVLPTGETVIEITVQQMDRANNVKITLDELKAKNTFLSSVVDSCRKAIPIIQSELKTFRDEISVKDAAIYERDAAILDVRSVMKFKDKRISQLQRHKAFIGVSGVVLVSLLTGLYITK